VRSLAERAFVKKVTGRVGRPFPPRSRPLVIVAGVAIALALGLGVILTAFGAGSDRQSAAKLSSPPWYGGPVGCREDPMAHVHDASRFIVVAKCATVSGTVKSAHLDPADGTFKMQVNVDSAYQRFLTAPNRGVLTAAVIPTDQPSVVVPSPGQHLTLYGAWVEERVVNGVGRVRLHPTWGVQVSDPGQSVAPLTASQGRFQQPAASPSSSPHVDLAQSLSVKVTAPTAVKVGAPMAVSIAVESLLDGQPKPAPTAALYCEVVADQGRLVQWKAATANGNGMARIDMVTTAPPGDYTLWVYAHKGIQGGIGRVRFSVSKG